MSVHGHPVVLLPFFYVVTVVGGGWGLLALLPFAVHRVTRTATLWLLGAITVQSALVTLLKELFGRVRPCDALAFCEPLFEPSPGGHSFPSGHAAGSFAFAGFVAARSPRWSPLVFLWAVVVGLSRCVLGVHYPSDVLAGGLLGAVVGVLFAKLSMRLSAQR